MKKLPSKYTLKTIEFFENKLKKLEEEGNQVQKTNSKNDDKINGIIYQISICTKRIERETRLLENEL